MKDKMQESDESVRGWCRGEIPGWSLYSGTGAVHPDCNRWDYSTWDFFIKSKVTEYLMHQSVLTDDIGNR